MKFRLYPVAALMTAMVLGGGQTLANTCRAENLTCPTAMPVGGYCECTSRGVTKGDDVTARDPHEHYNSTAGGCGANPGAPGCR
jgi:hypothetical protein